MGGGGRGAGGGGRVPEEGERFSRGRVPGEGVSREGPKGRKERVFVMLLPCPWCGPRSVAEFGYVGEATTRPDPAEATPEQWRAYLYDRANPCGWTTETWYHRMGCRRYVPVERHTLTNEARPRTTERTTGGNKG